MSDDPRFDALRPTPAEIATVREPLPQSAARQLAAWSAPSAEEVARLQARAPRRIVPSVARPGWGGLVVAAVVLLLLGREPIPTPSAPMPAAPDITASADLVLPTGPLRLNPDIQAEGAGDLRVLAASDAGARVEVQGGAITFEVDPRGTGRDLVVVAGAVEVQVTGTRFTVSRHGDTVRVSVERGAVQVRYPDGLLTLHAGEDWSTRDALAALAPAPAPAPAPAVSVVRAPAPPTPEPPPVMIEGIPATPGRGVELFVTLLDAEEDGRPPAELLVLCDAFLSAYGAVPMREEVEVMRLRQLRMLRPAGAVLSEAEGWLREHTGSPHHDEISLMVGDLLAEALGDCAEALPYYKAVMETSSNPAQQDRARARITGCGAAP